MFIRGRRAGGPFGNFLSGKSAAFVLLFVIMGIPLPAGSIRDACAEPGQDIAALTHGWTYCFLSPHVTPMGAAPALLKRIQWRPWDLKQTLKPESEKALWMRRTLNDPALAFGALFLPRYSCFRGFETYLEQARIYRSGTLYPSLVNRHLYIRWHLIPLPTDYFGKTLYFRFFSDHHHIIGFHSAIYQGAPAVILNQMVLNELDITLVGLLMIIGGLFGGLFLAVYYRLNNLSLAYASSAAVFAGIYSLTESNVTQLMFDRPILLSYLHYVTFFLLAAAILAFMEQTVGGRWKEVCRWGALFQIAYATAAMLLDMWRIVSWDMTFNAGMALLGLSILAMEFQLLKTAVAGNLEARLLCLGLGLLGLSGLWDILVGLRVLSPRQVVFPWGLVSMVASLGLVVALRYQAERRQAQETIRKSEERFRYLFENAPISILEVDFKSGRPRVIHVNRAAKRLFGLAAGNSGQPALEELLSGDAVLDLHLAVNSPAPGAYTALETSCRRLNQAAFPARVGASRTALFGLSRVVLTIEDITEEKERRSEEEAIAEERRRIAREIHDGLAQDLAVMNMKTGVWPLLRRSHPERMAGEIEFLQQTLKKSIAEVRRCIFALRPVELEALGFFEAIRRFAKDFGGHHQLSVSLEITGNETDLPARLEPALFRIIQETLNNVHKHASARTVRVHLKISGRSTIKLTVADDGGGFDTATLPSMFRDGHLGIGQMQERISRLGGAFRIRSGHGAGTTIEVDLPLI